MDQADSVHSTPPTKTSASNPPGGPESPQDSLYLPTPTTPEEAFQTIGRLRKDARDEINRLIQFLDKTDDYVSRELEDDDDQGDASYPEGGSRLLPCPGEDDEDIGDFEPSLGSSGHGAPGSISYAVHTISDGFQLLYDCEGDEHDGCELEDEHGDDADKEPSLGWPERIAQGLNHGDSNDHETTGGEAS